MFLLFDVFLVQKMDILKAEIAKKRKQLEEKELLVIILFRKPFLFTNITDIKH